MASSKQRLGTSLAESLLRVASEYELIQDDERARFDETVRTLQSKISNLRITIDQRDEENERQAVLISELQQQLHVSRKGGDNDDSSKSRKLAVLEQTTSMMQQLIAMLRFELADKYVESATLVPEQVSDTDASSNNIATAVPTLLKPYSRISLFSLSRDGNTNGVRAILEPNVGEESVSALRKTLGVALSIAAAGGHTDLCRFLLSHNAEYTSVEPGTDRNVLHLASARGDVEVLKLLLNRKGIDALIDSTDREGNTPLHIASLALAHDCVHVLLRQGADPSAMDANNHTASDLIVATLAESNSASKNGAAGEEKIDTDKNKSPINSDRTDGREESINKSNSNVKHIVGREESLAGGGGGSGEISLGRLRKLAATRAALSDVSSLFWAHSVRANRLYTFEQYEDAKAAYQAAIDIAEGAPDQLTDSNRATLHYNMARTAVQVADHTDSILHCTTAIDLKGGFYPNALAQRAASYADLLEFKRALKDYETLARASKSSKGSGGSGSPTDWTPFVRRTKQMLINSQDLYEVLGAKSNATMPEIRRSFRKQCLKWHPDKHRGSRDSKTRSLIMFKALNEANEVLTDEQKRTQYDITRISRRVDDIARRSRHAEGSSGMSQQQQQQQKQQYYQQQQRSHSQFPGQRDRGRRNTTSEFSSRHRPYDDPSFSTAQTSRSSNNSGKIFKRRESGAMPSTSTSTSNSTSNFTFQGANANAPPATASTSAAPPSSAVPNSSDKDFTYSDWFSRVQEASTKAADMRERMREMERQTRQRMERDRTAAPLPTSTTNTTPITPNTATQESKHDYFGATTASATATATTDSTTSNIKHRTSSNSREPQTDTNPLWASSSRNSGTNVKQQQQQRRKNRYTTAAAGVHSDRSDSEKSNTTNKSSEDDVDNVDRDRNPASSMSPPTTTARATETGGGGGVRGSESDRVRSSRTRGKEHWGSSHNNSSSSTRRDNNDIKSNNNVDDRLGPETHDSNMNTRKRGASKHIMPSKRDESEAAAAAAAARGFSARPHEQEGMGATWSSSTSSGDDEDEREEYNKINNHNLASERNGGPVFDENDVMHADDDVNDGIFRQTRSRGHLSQPRGDSIHDDDDEEENDLFDDDFDDFEAEFRRRTTNSNNLNNKFYDNELDSNELEGVEFSNAGRAAERNSGAGIGGAAGFVGAMEEDEPNYEYDYNAARFDFLNDPTFVDVTDATAQATADAIHGPFSQHYNRRGTL